MRRWYIGAEAWFKKNGRGQRDRVPLPEGSRASNSGPRREQPAVAVAVAAAARRSAQHGDESFSYDAPPPPTPLAASTRRRDLVSERERERKRATLASCSLFSEDATLLDPRGCSFDMSYACAERLTRKRWKMISTLANDIIGFYLDKLCRLSCGNGEREIVSHIYGR